MNEYFLAQGIDHDRCTVYWGGGSTAEAAIAECRKQARRRHKKIEITYRSFVSDFPFSGANVAHEGQADVYYSQDGNLIALRCRCNSGTIKVQ